MDAYSTMSGSSADELCKKLKKLQNNRQLLERQWRISYAFYKGNQYTFYNNRSRRIETLPVGEGEKPRYRVRLVSNQILPGAQSLLAKLTKTKATMAATPQSSDEDSVKASTVADALLEYWWDNFELASKDKEALLWGIIAGNGYWHVCWDDKKGTPVKFMLDPQGNPILQPTLRTYFKEQLKTQGVDPLQFEKTIYMGDIDVGVLSPFQVYLDDSAKTFEDCKWCIIACPMTASEIKARWGGEEVKPDSVPQAPDETVPMGSNLSNGDKTVKNVYFYYHIPTANNPEGSYIIFIENPNRVLYEEKWPYPFRQLPLVQFPGIKVPGSLYDISVVEQAVPLQKELNRTLSQIVEWKNVTLRPQYLAPAGALRQRITDEPGAVFEYNPIGNNKPEPVPVAPLPSYVMAVLEDIKQRMDEVFYRREVDQGQVPPNVEAGIAIDLLQETATDAIAPIVAEHEKALERAANLMLQMAQKFYIEPRIVQINGAAGQRKVEQFNQANLAAGVTVKVETGSSLPRTRSGRQARVMQMVSMGILTPDKAVKYLDMADLKSLQNKFQQDEDQASREHDKLLKGVPLNQVAANGAVGLVQSGQPNPETGQPFDPQSAQEFVQKASVSPNTYDNHPVHLDVHGLLLKSLEFEALPPEIQHLVVMHYEQHMQAMYALAAQQQPIQPVRTSLQVKSSLGPSATAAILNRSGVPGVTPETLLEPPLDTMVIDNLDKPNADDAGKTIGVDEAHDQKMLHNEELQAQKLRFAEELNRVKASGQRTPAKN